MKETTKKEEIAIKVDKEEDTVIKNHNQTATFGELFSQAEPHDYLLMALGVIGGLGTGASLPIFNILFGKILDALNNDPSSFSTAIDTLSLDFLYIGLGKRQLIGVCTHKSSQYCMYTFLIRLFLYR